MSLGHGLGGGESERLRFEVSLPLDVAVLAGMRQRLRDVFGEWGLRRQVRDTVLLCIQEACKNAIRFSGSPKGIDVTVGLERDAVRAVVRDYGEGFFYAGSPERPEPLAPSGRGLFLINALMDSVHITQSTGMQVSMVKQLA